MRRHRAEFVDESGFKKPWKVRAFRRTDYNPRRENPHRKDSILCKCRICVDSSKRKPYNRAKEKRAGY